MTFAQPFADYEILDRVGAGAMGTVFKARHKRLNRIVALKVLKPSLARDSRYVDRLRREARIVASLSHPNIVTGYDLGEEAGYHYFVMEFVEGKSLRAMLAEWGMFAEPYVMKVARQVALALDHAWQRGVIHRDIKPGNILIDEAGNVKLTDMGLAKGPADLTLTRDGATVGTPQYISPEQARNPHDVDVRTDLYSLGATLYHMATGVPPFRGDTMAELITAVLHELPVSPKAINSALSEGMSLVIRKLLAKDLTVRYQTPRDLLDDLDRLERSLPPQIDPARLAEQAGENVRWWPRLLLGLGVLVLLGLAWWLGVRTQPPAERPPTASEFLVALDAELAALATPGQRHARLRTITSVPDGSERELQQRLRRTEAELQAAVDRVVDGFLGAGFPEFLAWLRDPKVWPDRATVERERIQPRLLAAVGLAPAHLPATTQAQALEELRREVDRRLAERDGELIERFAAHLTTRLAAQAEERVRANDFASAEKIWAAGLLNFCDGVRRPALERLSESTAAVLRERFLIARRAAETLLADAERDAATALKAEVVAVCASLTERLRSVDPELIAAELAQFRQTLEHDWPPANCFRADRNPWHDLERQFGVLSAEIRAARNAAEEARFAGRCDLVWRAFCHGRASDAAALLLDLAEPGSERAERAERHRVVLAAASAVEAAVVQAMAKTNQPTIAFLRAGGADPLEIRVEVAGTNWRLVGNSVNQPPRTVNFGELRFGDLLTRMQAVGDPLSALAPTERALGSAVFRLLGDDLAGVAATFAAVDPQQAQFLRDEIWPRILRVRGEQDEVSLDRAGLFARVTEARAAAEKGGLLSELEKALLAAGSRVPEVERSPAEATLLRRAEAWLRLERRRQALANELQQTVPPGAEVEVRIADQELVAEVTMGPAALLRDAAEWHLKGDAIEFADGGRPWSELALQTLRGNSGIEPTAARTILLLDFVLPPATVGTRFWVLEFRGIAIVLVVGADDSVHAALVEGDVRREADVHQAFMRAMSGIMVPSKARAVPGGVHRLTIEVAASTLRDRAAVRVLFEGCELFPAAKGRRLNPHQPPTFAIYPQQDLAVHRVVVRGEGL